MKNKRILSFILTCLLIVCTSGEVFAKQVDKTDVDDLSNSVSVKTYCYFS